MNIKELLLNLEAYSNMGEGDTITVTCDLLSTLESALNYIENNEKKQNS